VAPFEVMPVDSQTVPFIRQHWAKIPNLPRSITFDTVEAFAEAREPKKLVWLPRHLGHWGAYVGEGFERVMTETLAWYEHWLPIEA
jgi:hypothetical protein